MKKLWKAKSSPITEYEWKNISYKLNKILEGIIYACYVCTSWYHNKRNPVHGSFLRTGQALQEAGVKITVAYNEIWLNLTRKVKEKIA